MKRLLACILLSAACLAQTPAPSSNKQKVLWQKLRRRASSTLTRISTASWVFD